VTGSGNSWSRDYSHARHPGDRRLVQMHLVMIRLPSAGGFCVFANNARGGFPPVADELVLRYRAWRQHEHAVVETVVPEIVEPRVPILFGIQRLSPEAAEVRVEVRRMSEPLQQALLRRARVEERRDRRCARL